MDNEYREKHRKFIVDSQNKVSNSSKLNRTKNELKEIKTELEDLKKELIKLKNAIKYIKKEY